MRLKENPIKLIKKLDQDKTKILSATVVKRAHKWYVNLAVEEEISTPYNSSTSTIGVDLGFKGVGSNVRWIICTQLKTLENISKQIKKDAESTL